MLDGDRYRYESILVRVTPSAVLAVLASSAIGGCVYGGVNALCTHFIWRQGERHLHPRCETGWSGICGAPALRCTAGPPTKSTPTCTLDCLTAQSSRPLNPPSAVAHPRLPIVTNLRAPLNPLAAAAAAANLLLASLPTSLPPHPPCACRCTSLGML